MPQKLLIQKRSALNDFMHQGTKPVVLGCQPRDDLFDEFAVGELQVGAGETRSVSTLTPATLDVLPPGSSVQKALNFLPGVNAQSIDALGINEQSLAK